MMGEIDTTRYRLAYRCAPKGWREWNFSCDGEVFHCSGFYNAVQRKAKDHFGPGRIIYLER